MAVLSTMILALAACTGASTDRASPTVSPEQSAESPPTALTVPETVLCGGRGILDVWISVDRLVDQRAATELGPRAAAAVQRQDLGPNASGVAFDSLPSDWFIGEESADRVILLQRLPLPDGLTADDPGAVALPDYSMRLFLIDPPVPADLRNWFPVFENECSFEIPLQDLRIPDLMIDDALKDPAATHLDLLVHERECTSGRSAEGRIKVVALRETADRIELAIGIRPPDGSGVATCVGNRPTPFRLALSSALGDRDVVDLGRVPALPVPVVTFQEW
ncbi:hypothetical protein [Microbacterium sp. LWH12-1.2]|uniref:hypothetical protein n=1 Tax=Microbacterium sp. LWH12-1.2 TaxID=3135259 RepID=UPI0034162A5F